MGGKPEEGGQCGLAECLFSAVLQRPPHPWMQGCWKLQLGRVPGCMTHTDMLEVELLDNHSRECGLVAGGVPVHLLGTTEVPLNKALNP